MVQHQQSFQVVLYFLSIEKAKLLKIKQHRRQRSGIDTIKYHNWEETPFGKMTKTQETITPKRAKRSVLSQ